MAKFLFFAHDPGGANAIEPLIVPLKKNGHEVLVYAKNTALSKAPNVIELKENDFQAFFKRLKPDCIITGTSANDFTEKLLWKTAKEMNIKSVAILDYWSNYGIRFSKYGTKDIEKYNSDKTFDYLPNFIIVMDEFAKAEMSKEGIPENIIYVLGNPHFLKLKELSKNVDKEKIRSQFMKRNEEFMITFASQPYTEDYGKGQEKQVLKDLQEIVEKMDKRIAIVVKLHPKEDLSKYNGFENIYLDTKTHPIDIIMSSDLVVSLTSMFLVEAMILGKKVVSYQPMESNKDKFVFTRNGILEFINAKSEFEIEINEQIANKVKTCENVNVNINAVELIIDFLENEVCQN